MLELLLHVIPCLLCMLLSTQLQHSVSDTASRHLAATCNFSSNRAVFKARASNTQNTCVNSASCMLQLSNDRHTAVNWCNKHAAKPAAVVQRPYWTNSNAEHARSRARSLPTFVTRTTRRSITRPKKRRAYCSSTAQPAKFHKTVTCLVVTSSAVTQMHDACCDTKAFTHARTRQRSQQHLSPPQRLQLITQSSNGTDLTKIWNDAGVTNISTSQHEVHLHPTGHGYSSDDSGDGPSTASPPAPLPTPSAPPSHTPSPTVLLTPGLRAMQTSRRHRRRTHMSPTPPACTRGTNTNYYPYRVYTPHVAVNPANYTPDYDPDKQ